MAGKTWSQGYAFRPFQMKTTHLEFSFSRRSTLADPNSQSKGSNISAVWTPRLQETLINGVLQGRKQTDPKGASQLSRNKMWTLCQDTDRTLGRSLLVDPSSMAHKRTGPLATRQQVKEDAKKEALRVWGKGASQMLDVREMGSEIT